MKNLLSILIMVLVLTVISCQQKVNPENEKEAVLKVLQQEGVDFAKSNIEGICAIHVQDESTTRLEGSKVYSGWNAIKELYDKYLTKNKADTIARNMRNIKENVIVKVNGNSAWVVCDNIWKWDANGKNQGFRNKQIAVFEKNDGQWKFVLNAFFENQNP